MMQIDYVRACHSYASEPAFLWGATQHTRGTRRAMNEFAARRLVGTVHSISMKLK